MDRRVEGNRKSDGENGMTVQVLEFLFLGKDNVLSESMVTVRHPCAKIVIGLYTLSTGYLVSKLSCKGFCFVES